MSRSSPSAVMATLGIDLGKNTFHLIGEDERGAIVLRIKLSRPQLTRRLANIPPCRVGMGRFGKQGFTYEPDDDTYRCPASETLTRRLASIERGITIDVYWTTRCAGCALKAQCTTGRERRIRRWRHEAVLEAMEARLRARPDAMQVRKCTVEHVFGTLKG